jgi:hypothetical protein
MNADKPSPGRPPVKRNAETFLRDIYALRRLKLSLIKFHHESSTAQDAVKGIEELIGKLFILRDAA